MKRSAIGAGLLAALFCLQACAPGAYNAPTPLSQQSVNTATPATLATPDPTPERAATPAKTRPTPAKVMPTPERLAPAGATARCRDGSYSYSQHRRGTCSHHHGVAQWFD